MKADKQAIITRLLKHEGGYSNTPGDKGGPTKYGITIADLSESLGRKATIDEVKAMSLQATALPIYDRKYWAKMRGDELPAGVDDSIFDYAVNSGNGRPPRVVQTLLRLKVTGVMDDATMRAIQAYDPDKLVDAINDERLRFMKAIRGGKDWKLFHGGWGTRVSEFRDYSHALVKIGKEPEPQSAATVAASPTLPVITPLAASSSPKAIHAPNKIVRAASGTVAGAGGVATAGGAGSGSGTVAVGGIVTAIVGGIVMAFHEWQVQQANMRVHAEPLA